MFDFFEYLHSISIQDKNKHANHKLYRLVQNYSFYNITKNFNIVQNEEIKQNIKESEVILINKRENFFIIGFKKTLIIVNQDDLSNLKNLFLNLQSIFYFSNNAKHIFNQFIGVSNDQREFDPEIIEEINNFNENILVHGTKEANEIMTCLTGYLLIKSHIKLDKKRINDFINETKERPNSSIKNYTENDYIEIRLLESTSSCTVSLIYMIDTGDLLAIKKLQKYDKETLKLNEQEYQNYLNINHPLLPKLFGIVQNNNSKSLIIQYINGHTLYEIERYQYSEKEKYSIIFHIMLIFNYFQVNNYIYRDLKPKNVMIDKNNFVFIIDFDRMKKFSNNSTEKKHTQDFGTIYTSPEVNSDKTDIYSIGQIIYYIMNEASPLNDYVHFSNQRIEAIYKKCTLTEYDQRPSIFDLIFEFYSIVSEYLDESIFKEFHEFRYCEGILKYSSKYIEQNINKSIRYLTLAASQNNQNALFILGIIYLEGKYITQNVNKSIQYLTLAANQNHPESQILLGTFYYEGKYITQNISKSIKYLTFAANQNHPYAQYQLGFFYYEGKYITQNINKSIQYLTLAAIQNISEAQFILGIIYSEGKYIERDINKSIQYYTLAANQNHSGAQFDLGFIYYEGKYIARDINKSIQYLTLAANQNHLNAQLYLTIIYFEGKYIAQDINKTIYYLTLAANQNHLDAQYALGSIYIDGKYIERDINKSIYYLTLAANQNHLNAQYILSSIYIDGKYIERDINKSIYYLTLAANQNHSEAQNFLGHIYYSGKYVERDINKSIRYLTLAAEKKHLLALLFLGSIYIGGKYIARDINKSIYYLTLAANQNYPEAQYYLGCIYYDGRYITRDINKSIYYLTLSANQNHLDSQIILGIIYYEGIYIDRDIKKSIRYLTLAANQNHQDAQFKLGRIYYDGKYVERDINKSIRYLTLAANQNHQYAQNLLGCIYYENNFIKRNISKSIYYLTLAANQNHSEAQLNLGILYIDISLNRKNIIKGIDWIIQSALNKNIGSYFYVGYFYQEGKYVERDMKKSIHYYKESSSFNNCYSKNNLGIIYKNGIGVTNSKNIGYAIEYFEESIRYGNDEISMYNLSHIYIYEDMTEENLNKSINHLIKSSNKSFYPSNELLCIALIRKNGKNLEKIKKELIEKTNGSNDLPNRIIKIIEKYDLIIENIFQYYYEYYRTIDYLYNCFHEPIQSKYLIHKESNNPINKSRNNITSQFYEGFGNPP